MTDNDIFGVRCPNGHVSYYNKRDYCGPSGTVKREGKVVDGKVVDVVMVRCKTPGCQYANEERKVPLNCEGYR